MCEGFSPPSRAHKGVCGGRFHHSQMWRQLFLAGNVVTTIWHISKAKLLAEIICAIRVRASVAVVMATGTGSDRYTTPTLPL